MSEDHPHLNEVVLVGRLSKEPHDRELPSGTRVTIWRLAVRRLPNPVRRAGSDAIDCVTFDDGVRESVGDWRVDDVVEVRGALRRRWWQGGSLFEIDVRSAGRVRRAHPPQAERAAPAAPAASAALVGGEGSQHEAGERLGSE